MKRNRSAAFALAVAATLLSACATYTATTTATNADALEQAKRAYVAGSIDYDFALKVVTELRAARLLNDRQWIRVMNATAVAREWAPLVGAMLKSWEQFGEKPKNYDQAFGHLATAQAIVIATKNETKP